MNKGFYGISKNRTYDTKYHVLVESASYASTASTIFPYTGSADISGSLTVNGTTTIIGEWNGNFINGLHLSFGHPVTGPNIGQIYSIENGASWRRLDVEGNPLILNGQSGGNVGIGYGSVLPSYTLDVSGSGNFTNGLIVTGSIRATSFTGSFSGSVVGYVSNEATSSFIRSTQTGSFITNQQTSSFVTSQQTSSFITNQQTSSFVRDTQTGSFALTNADNTFTGDTNAFQTQIYVSNVNNATAFNSEGAIHTDGGLRVTKDAWISGSLYVNNLTVYGTQSIQYITSSQLNISTNLITVNTATPAVRFGGLAVYDSGSNGTTGSLLWDSQRNVWIYNNPSGGLYDGSVLLMGPRSTTLGNEEYITKGYLVVADGSHHTTSSQIYNSESVIRLETDTQITGSLSVSGFITASLSGSVVGYVSNEATGSFITNQQTSSFVLNTQTSSFVTNDQTSSMTVSSSSYSETASYALNASGGGLTRGEVLAMVNGLSNLF
jgi:cytoskeletal protein CcmA (bactofilin family)